MFVGMASHVVFAEIKNYKKTWGGALIGTFTPDAGEVKCIVDGVVLATVDV